MDIVLKYRNLYIFVIVFFFSCLPFFANGAKPLSDDHDHVHDLHNWHLGFGSALTKIKGEDKLAPGLHFHLIRQIGHERKFGIGLGYEAIVDKHSHNGLNLIFNVVPFDKLSFNISPGLTFTEHDNNAEIKPSGHLEVIYEIDFRKIHIGPMIGYGFDKEDSHFAAGIHVGFGF